MAALRMFPPAIPPMMAPAAAPVPAPCVGVSHPEKLTATRRAPVAAASFIFFITQGASRTAKPLRGWAVFTSGNQVSGEEKQETRNIRKPGKGMEGGSPVASFLSLPEFLMVLNQEKRSRKPGISGNQEKEWRGGSPVASFLSLPEFLMVVLSYLQSSTRRMIASFSILCRR